MKHSEILGETPAEWGVVVLASMLSSDNCLKRGIARLTAEDFVLPLHKEVFEEAKRQSVTGKPVDDVTVGLALKAQRDEVFAIGRALLGVPEEATFDFYVDAMLSDKCKERVRQLCDSPFLEPEEVEAEFQTYKQAITRVAEYDRAASLAGALDAIDRRMDEARHIPVGLTDVDECLGGGILPGELLVLGGYPGAGKTALAMWMMRTNLERGHTCLFLSYEMDEAALICRMMGQHLKIPVWKFRKGRNALDESEWAAMTRWCGEAMSVPFVIVDAAIPAYDIRELAARHRPTLLIIDSLQYIPFGRSRMKKHEAMEWLMPTLVDMAKSQEMAVVAISHLSKPSAEEPRTPGLHKLKDSSAIEQMAHAVVFIHQETDDGRKRTLVGIAKNREGPTRGLCEVYFDGQTLSFGDMAKEKDWADEGDGDGFGF
jgi:replicative DNA helicase